MATIIVTTNSKKEAKKLLAKVYEADRQGGYTNNKTAFSGSVLTAQITDDNSVKIQSGYYQETSLKSMFE
jgi:hypothetical protein